MEYVLTKTQHQIEDFNTAIKGAVNAVESIYRNAELGLSHRLVTEDDVDKVVFVISLNGIKNNLILLQRTWVKPATEKGWKKIDAEMKRQLNIRMLFSPGTIKSLNDLLRKADVKEGN